MIRPRQGHDASALRDRVIAAVAVLIAIFIGIRLFQLQVVGSSFYKTLAQGQREIFSKLIPERGDILVHDKGSAQNYPVATNRDLWLIYSDNRKLTDPKGAAKALAPLLAELTDVKDDNERVVRILQKQADLEARLGLPDDPYEPLMHGADDDFIAKVKALNIPSIEFSPEKARFYTDKDFGGQVLGFLGYSGDEKTGRYGIEGYWDKELTGIQGFLSSERDPSGHLITIADRQFREKQDGDDLLLTIDRTLQAYACAHLRDWVKQHGADAGSVVMLDVKTGAVMVMCNAPDFDPNEYRKVDGIRVYNNMSIFTPYEAGSVIKTMTMSAAIDSGKVTPTTTYEDKGQEQVDDKVIKNSDGVAHGVQTMIQVLDESLNTGAIFAMRQIGAAKLREYFEAFGFGTLTGIELNTETAGNTASFKKKGEVYAATASFGQGFTATVLQLATAYAAIANEGKLMKPYIVDKIIKPDGTEIQTAPRTIRQVITQRTALLVSGMLVSVVENGHGKRAKVPGYYIAGKTGTAQVSRQGGLGYEEGVTIGTFAGYAPESNPRFAMVVRVDHPRDVQFAESSAAPLWGDIAKFALQYLEVPPDEVK